jgi:uncharacterized repeat protein (TIGR03803 family)
VLALVLGSGLTGPVTAQTFTVLHNFAATSKNLSGYDTNSDGALPLGGLLLSGDTLYGTTSAGGNSGNGTVFKINSEGLGLTTLHNFDTLSWWSPRTNNFGSWTNADGAQPLGSLVSSGNTIYGVTRGGGTFGSGTIFAIKKDGTGFTNLHIFGADTLTNSDGVNPYAGPILSDNALYGTTQHGGIGWGGTVFKLNTNGMAFSVLHAFFDSGDGASPEAELISAGNTLYGTAASGIDSVFTINPDGSGYRRLYDFAPTTFNGSVVTNSEGFYPQSSMILSGTILYGTAKSGGNFGYGTVFALNNDGSGFTNLHNFTGGNDGANPRGALVLLGHVLYGASESGGNSGCGTVFAIDTNGTNFRTLHSFSNNDDGCAPIGLILSGHALYGTASFGGLYNNGTVFAISLQPQLALVPFGSNLLLSWPTNFTGFILQSATDLNSPVWTTNLPAPVVVKGHYTVTNPISGTQQFFRLSQ